jgi:hypothetical protein
MRRSARIVFDAIVAALPFALDAYRISATAAQSPD